MKNSKSSTRVSYAAAVYGPQEIQAVVSVLKNPAKIVAGPAVKEFEKKIAGLFGKKYGVMVNSGSSANLMALEALNLPKGSEVITPVLTFSTTLAPLLQKGLKPVFADVAEGTYVIDPGQVERLVTKKTKALMIPSLIGNIPDLAKLRSIAKKRGLKFIEDSCDVLGATFAGKPTGLYSDVSTTSFYASHIITAAGSGGLAAFHDPLLARKALVMSNWGRESTLFGAYEKSEEIKKRFVGSIAGIPYDAKFIFSEIGYNLQATELSGAFGLEQLKRLNEFSARRKKNFADLLGFFSSYEHLFILPKQDPRAKTPWLAFPLTIRPDAGFSRKDITLHLEKQGVQTRPIFTGNVLLQPAFKNLRSRFRADAYPAANQVMRSGFLIGCHHGMTKRQLDYMKNAFTEFLNR